MCDRSKMIYEVYVNSVVEDIIYRVSNALSSDSTGRNNVSKNVCFVIEEKKIRCAAQHVKSNSTLKASCPIVNDVTRDLLFYNLNTRVA